MSKSIATAVTLALVCATSACGVLEPRLPDAQPSIPAQWPLPPMTATAPVAPAAAAGEAEAAAADIGWRDFFVDPRLEDLIDRALRNNRDLRVAVLNVERARQSYRIQRADRVPSVGAAGTMVRQGGDGQRTTETYAADLAVTAFELDLFGRVRNLSETALQRYFAQEEARRSAQLSLVAEVASVYLTLAADQEQLELARETLRTWDDNFAITQKRHEFGAVSALDVHQARTQVEAARADLARYAGQIAQDVNALNLLVGGTVDPGVLPTGFDPDVTGLDALPVGLPSDVLLRRPDVLEAERQLRGANANIGAARAAFFPSITLTGAVGSASDELSGLLGSGTNTWSFVPRVNVPIFEGGRLRANLGAARADRDIALAQYEGTIQRGFREVADALALTSTLASQRQALEQLVEAATKAEELSIARYEAGRDSYLIRLEAQRTLYVSQQALITTRLAEQTNRVTLYQVLGGGWREATR
ncbi:MAG TPA: efflux transporter outer membrane subunit [Steroidobacteraceae bacterium]|nr:efflux transporter outer membrane subunit [Steroidobacteraceae bacterium]